MCYKKPLLKLFYKEKCKLKFFNFLNKSSLYVMFIVITYHAAQ